MIGDIEHVDNWQWQDSNYRFRKGIEDCARKESSELINAL
jgi:hypothetical protein